MYKSSEIKALRKRLGLTPAGFALAVGCSRQTVRNWEMGRSVQPRYRDRLDTVAKTAAVETRSTVAGAGKPLTLTGVAEYVEEYPVALVKNDHGRVVIMAVNEGGHNSTEVDLFHLISWLKTNRPELLA